jgi:nicotinate-nucleotide--dimethylbenzimidazole phosphoribosyltransferase
MSLLQETIKVVAPVNEDAMAQAQKHLDYLLKPQGSLGKLETIARRTAGITGNVKNRFHKKVIMVMGADNGIVSEGVASFPQDVSMLVTDCMLKGMSGVSVLARHAGAELRVVDLGLLKTPATTGLIDRKIRLSTSNFVKEQAMTYEEAITAIEIGIDETLKVIDQGFDLIGTGEIGIGNTTTSSAILHVLSGESLDLVVGRGAGLSDEGLATKRESIRKAINFHKPNANDPIDVLAKVGGFDIAGLVGVYLAGASRKVPVVIDGFISGVAAIIAMRLAPNSVGYMFTSHGSAEPGAKVISKMLGMEPMLYMDMRLGEGTGCALAFHIMDASMAIMNEQGTFGDIGM